MLWFLSQPCLLVSKQTLPITPPSTRCPVSRSTCSPVIYLFISLELPHPPTYTPPPFPSFAPLYLSQPCWPNDQPSPLLMPLCGSSCAANSANSSFCYLQSVPIAYLSLSLNLRKYLYFLSLSVHFYCLMVCPSGWIIKKKKKIKIYDHNKASI